MLSAIYLVHLIFRTRLIKFRIASSPKLPFLSLSLYLFFPRKCHQLEHIGFYFRYHCNWERLSMDLITFKTLPYIECGVCVCLVYCVPMVLLLLSNAFQAAAFRTTYKFTTHTFNFSYVFFSNFTLMRLPSTQRSVCFSRIINLFVTNEMKIRENPDTIEIPDLNGY